MLKRIIFKTDFIYAQEEPVIKESTKLKGIIVKTNLVYAQGNLVFKAATKPKVDHEQKGVQTKTFENLRFLFGHL